MDRIAHLQTHFGRFLWDILGVLFLAFALMTLLGIFKLIQRHPFGRVGKTSLPLVRLGGVIGGPVCRHRRWIGFSPEPPFAKGSMAERSFSWRSLAF